MNISGAEDPRAMSERLAIVAFKTGNSTKNFFLPSLSQTSCLSVTDVIYSIASMNLSAIMDIPMNKLTKHRKYTAIINPLLNSWNPFGKIMKLSHCY